jgi:hypothetical protein
VTTCEYKRRSGGGGGGDPENGVPEAHLEGIEDGLDLALGLASLDHGRLFFPGVFDRLQT